MAWPDASHANGWLALPHNGQVMALSELFGNFTPQPPSEQPNGFLALAVYDLNHDGVIDARDSVYSRLRVWIDTNHDGISQPEELHTLPELKIDHINLHYRLSQRTDENGNEFRYVALIDDQEAPNDRRCYDVIVKTLPMQ